MFNSRDRLRLARMHRWLALCVLGVSMWGAAAAQSSANFPGIGRPATPKEIAAWDIDVRPDFKGLPQGSGSVAQGMEVWEAKCASCHGVFGESNETFSPLVGGTTAKDITSGRVARLTDESFPGRTTLMKLSSLSTLWDYINRAMPWNAPKSLSTTEVYAVTAYLLNLGGIVPDDFTLSDVNMAEVQNRLPNRNGMTTDHAMWPGKGMGRGQRPDVKATACMKDCLTEAKVASFLPEHARNAHGNLAEQNRLVGPQVGTDTTRPAPARMVASAGGSSVSRPSATAVSATSGAKPGAAVPAAVQALLNQHSCLSCHGVDKKVVGPGLREITRKYATRADAASYLSQRIVAGSAGVWGSIPMPAQNIPKADAQALATWLSKAE